MDRSVLRGIGIIIAAAVVFGVMFLLPGPKSRHHEVENLDPWKLVSEKPDGKYGTYLGNGLISTRILGDGVGSYNGQPLQCFMAGLYDDEKLVPAPTWSDIRFYDGKDEFRLDLSEEYSQRLNMRTGVLITTGTWRCGRKLLVGEIGVIVSRSQPNTAMIIAALTSNFDGDIRVENIVKPTTDRLKMTMPLRVGIGKKDSFPIAIYSTRQSGINLALAVHLESETMRNRAAAKKTLRDIMTIKVRREVKFMVRSYAALAASPDARAASKRAQNEMISAVGQGLDYIAKSKAAWENIWKKDIVIEGSPKDQQAIHSCMFYLLGSVREGSQWSIPPMGLSSIIYSGHIFWDADVWMFPALIMQHPQFARSIVDYRYNTLPGAMANAKADGFAGAQYAWESGYTGREDTPGNLVYRHERHINGDVALAQWQYYLATGDKNWLRDRGYPVLKATADYWVSRVKLVNNRYEILQVVPPDENAGLVNNSAYTNAIAKMNLEFASDAAKITGRSANPKWAEIASKIYIPIDQKNHRFIAHDGYKGVDAKQADTELLIYPLQYPTIDQTLYKSTFDFYSPKVLKNGPAMTSSAHSVIAARLGDSDRAYNEFVRSYKDYLRGPFNYFNEKRSRTIDNTCFLTGAAGPIQATIFGLAGVKMDYTGQMNLAFNPALPKRWKSLRILGVQWQGKTFDVVVTHAEGARILPQ